MPLGGGGMAKDQKPRLGKRILLFLDGTWNDDDRDDAALTNIVRMRDLFASVLRQAAAAEKPAEDVDQAQSYQIGGRKYYVYYDRGVGTGAWLDALKGGAFGAGLSRNVRQAYKFLSFYYEPGDEIYVFGFSRGAYTARTLCGYVYAAGLLRKETCTPDNEAAASGALPHAGGGPAPRQMDGLAAFHATGPRAHPLPWRVRHSRGARHPARRLPALEPRAHRVP